MSDPGRKSSRRQQILETEAGTLLVTVNGSVITALSRLTPLEPGSDLLEAAERVIDTYGQPEQATLRDASGRITLDRNRARFVTLEYRQPRPVEFSLSGAPLWEYRIAIQDPRQRWHENKTLRCARAREQAAAE